jgi:hypothetical protein
MADIVPFYEEIGRTQSFETPSGPLVAESMSLDLFYFLFH